MKAIVCIDKRWGIGINGQLLYKIKEDMEFFKEMTLHKVVLMGRKTFESIGSKPLKDRLNIVLSNSLNQDDYIYDNLRIVSDEEDLDRVLTILDNNDIYVIGGEEIYKQFLSECDEIFVTHVDDNTYADRHFPEIAFEGFKPVEIVARGESPAGTSDNMVSWKIIRWTPYTGLYHRALISYTPMNSSEDPLKIYTNDIANWLEAFCCNEVTVAKPMAKFIKRALKQNYQKIETTYMPSAKIYKSDLNVFVINDSANASLVPNVVDLRCVGFGDTEEDAYVSLTESIYNLYKGK